MKPHLLKVLWLPLLFLAATLSASAGGIADKDAFLSELKAALNSKDKAKLTELTYTVGMADSDKATMAKMQDFLLKDQEIETMSFAPLRKGTPTFMVLKGKRFEPSAPLTGMVNITYKSAGNSNMSASIAYAIVDGSYWLVSTKTTDLNWTGPADVNIGFMVIGAGQDKVKVTAKYNASGVDIEQEFDTPSTITWGQHFTEIIVHCEDPATDVTLTVKENGAEIYKSEPLKGAGELKYQKK